MKYAQKNIPTKHLENKSKILYPTFFAFSFNHQTTPYNAHKKTNAPNKILLSKLLNSITSLPTIEISGLFFNRSNCIFNQYY